MKSRFAPSPTGYLHIGGVRTALFAYLWAKHNMGEFKLRIEDTDKQRSTPESIQAILDGMQWLGLKADGEIVYQTNRFNRYEEVIQQLLDEGKAYYCNCSKERLDNLREDLKKAGKKPKYDGKCRELGLKEGVVRFKNPTAGMVEFQDKVKGKITINNDELDDLIIKRSDGTPTYNLAVVIDDHDMAIDMVIRGDDHINNTPRQINLYYALGWQVPEFAHLPMILGGDGTRLSKRHGAMSVLEYKENGFLPQAVLNYLVRLGWGYGDKEIFSMAEMIELFSLDGVNKAPARFDSEKMLWLNGEYLKNMPASEILLHLEYHLNQAKITTDERILDIIDLIKERNKTLVDMVQNLKMFYSEITKFDEKLANKHFQDKAVLQALITELQHTHWSAEEIKNAIQNVCTTLEIGFGKVGQPFRLALSGDGNAGDISKNAALVGKEQTLQRLELAISY
jgi:glutamyl-tRNA synthetase